MGLTKSAMKERQRIINIHNQAAMETVQTILASGLPGNTKAERQKARWIAKGFEHATNALNRAIDETLPTPERPTK